MKNFLISFLNGFLQPFLILWDSDIIRRWLKLAVIPIVGFFAFAVVLWLFGLLLFPDVINPFIELCHNYWIGQEGNAWRWFTFWGIISLFISIVAAIHEE